MKVTFINHASLLLESDDSFLLTDPWVAAPAFGSWLPTFPPAIDPVALLSLGSRLTIVLSHFHGDHFDPDFLSCLDPTTRICLPRFRSRAMFRRLQQMGFNSITELTQDNWTLISSWNLLSVVSRKSDVDATVVIRTSECAVIHGNDNWECWHDEDLELIRFSLADINRSAIMNCSQANSASGYPLNYETFDIEQQSELLRQKVHRMCVSGMQNSRKLGLSLWYPYAGYASIFVKGHEEYLTRSIFPVPDQLRNLLKVCDTNPKGTDGVDIADFLPGDSVELKTGTVIPGFIRRTRLDLNRYREASSAFLRSINAVNRCETYAASNRPLTSHNMTLNELDILLDGVREAANLLISEKPLLASSLAQKRFGVEIRDVKLYGEIHLGTMSISHEKVGEPTETLVITSRILKLLCDGSMRANHLYIGYQGVWRRNPPHQFNSDIRQVLATYTYRIQPQQNE